MAISADGPLDGVNLLKPGKTPHQNIRFLIFLAAVLKGVHKHQGLLRAGIGTSGNEHRLGANEAPPAIISVFMGQMLTRLIENIVAGKEAGKGAEQQLIKLGVGFFYLTFHCCYGTFKSLCGVTGAGARYEVEYRGAAGRKVPENNGYRLSEVGRRLLSPGSRWRQLRWITLLSREDLDADVSEN
jgi:hypothetical protein